MSRLPTLAASSASVADGDVGANVLRAVQIKVDGSPRAFLPETTLTLTSGEVLVALGEPGHGHTALALALAGRLPVDHGTVTVDGDPRPSTLQRLVALVDVPGVSEPDDNLRLSTVVGEELAMAGLPAGLADVRACLEKHDVGEWAGHPIEVLPARLRTGLLADLAALRLGVRFLVITLPERFGDAPDSWLDVARELADRGLGVLVTASHAAAAILDVPTTLIGNGRPT